MPAKNKRLVNDWNILPTTVVDVSSINSFKRKLDEYFKYMDS